MSDVQSIERLFFRQMQRNTRLATSNVAQARARLESGKTHEQRAMEANLLHSLDFQFSDRWINA